MGGNGFVGGGFARTLRKTGVPFEIITRENYSSFIGKSCDVFINANGNSKKFLADEDPKREFLDSVASVRNSLVDFNFGTYVFLSTSDVYPDCSRPELTLENQAVEVAGQSSYGFHKYIAEQCIKHSAERWLIVRQGGFVGPGLKKNAVFDILHGDKIWVHSESRFQFIDTDSSAIAVLTLVKKGVVGEIVNITGRGTVSPIEIMSMAGRRVTSRDDLTPVTYEISIDKSKRWLHLPRTKQCVEKFVNGVKSDP